MCTEKQLNESLRPRVSVKFNNRPFAGIVTAIGDKKYMIPITSQTTEERKKEAKSSLIRAGLLNQNGTPKNVYVAGK